MKTHKKMVKVLDCISEDAVNVRRPDDYNLETMIPQLLMYGRVTDPVHVEPHPTIEGKYLVLRGNRRIRGCYRILTDPTVTTDDGKAITPEVKKGFEQVFAIIYEELTDRERTSLIYDHGQSEPLSRTAVVEAVWRLQREGRSEREILELMYSQLANYTGNVKKLNDPALKDPAKRSKFLLNWLHGTLQNKIMKAQTMGEYVKSQMILTSRFEDGKLAEGEVVEMNTSKGNRIQELSKAKTTDGDVWTYETGGPEFNKTIEQFKAEDSNKGPTKESRPSAKRLEELSAVYKSPILRKAMEFSAGKTDAGKVLDLLDQRVSRIDAVTSILAKHAPRIPNGPVRELVNAILGDMPVGAVEVAVRHFATLPEPEPLPNPPAEETVEAIANVESAVEDAIAEVGSEVAAGVTATGDITYDEPEPELTVHGTDSAGRTQTPETIEGKAEGGRKGGRARRNR